LNALMGYSGGNDAFVTKFNPTGTSLAWSTYLGGNGSDQGLGIAYASGHVVVVGSTTSAFSFPLVNPIMGGLPGSQGGFVAELNDLLPGASCSSGSDCASGFCADGVCCDTACGGQCDACNLAGFVGTCTNQATGYLGSPSCAPYLCNGSSAACPSTCAADIQCSTGNYCDGSGHCVPKLANGAFCTTFNSCLSAFCIDGVCCNSACGGACDQCDLTGAVGTCSPRPIASTGSPSCAPYLCSGASASCPTSCTLDTQCAPGNWCHNGSCVPTLANGAGCPRATACTSTICVDGVCCDSACGGACDACNLSGSVGTCSYLSFGSTGSPSCAPYVCIGNDSACPTVCSSDAECAQGYWCSNSFCVPKLANGGACPRDFACTTAYCIDGVCCDTPCGGACDACNLPGSVGTCTLSPIGSSGSPTCAPMSCTGTSAVCPPSNIPTLSEWGMAIMALLMTGAMWVGMRPGATRSESLE
jgi:hypothetical protein